MATTRRRASLTNYYQSAEPQRECTIGNGVAISTPKPPKRIRILYQNLNGLPTHNHHIKNAQLRAVMNKYDVDVLLGVEVNVKWDRVPFHHRLTERCRGWWESLQISTAYNTWDDDEESLQYGGTLTMVRNKAAHRVMDCGIDPKLLGRWSWVKLQGRAGIGLRLVSVYRPVVNLTGPGSVHNQHERYRLQHNRPGCPRSMLTTDLCHEIKQWLDQGDQLVIGIDLNEDVRVSSLSVDLKRLGLVEINEHNHSTLPETNQRGSKPIDALFVTRSLLASTHGYLDYGQAIPSDHRALWMDITFVDAFGHDPPQPVRPPARRLQCQDPRVVKAYTAHLSVTLQILDLPARAQRLREHMQDPPTRSQVLEWEAIDAEHVQAIEAAERQCRKLKMGSVPWSPTIQLAMDRVMYWQLQLKRLQYKKVSSKLLARLRKAAQLEHGTVTLQSAKASLQLEQANYKLLKKEADTLRSKWIEQLAFDRAQDTGSSTAAQLHQLRQREIARRDARVCRGVLKRLRPKSLGLVIAPDSFGNWRECTSREHIEQACLNENASRFQQAASTPFFQPPLVTLVDSFGLNHHAQSVLTGNFQCPVGVDQATRTYLHSLRFANDQSPPQFNLDLSPDEYRWRWRRAREATATGFSSLHFGHFKAGATHDIISEFECLKLNMPFRFGFAPNRWKKGLDVAIPKKPGNHRVDSLRTIILLEPDFNFLNKLLGSRMMAQAETLQLLATEQYGSRKHKSAVEHAVNKRLTFDLARQHRRPLAYCSIDAKACYDRISWPAASLSMQRVGTPAPPIRMMLSTLKDMQHHVSTTFGVSPNYYDGALLPNLHGVGQGNGAAPSIWAVVSSPLLQIQRQAGFQAHFTAPISLEDVSVAGFAFVDDTDLCISASALETSDQLQQKLQLALNSWNGSLRATGGALVPEKSFWVLTSFIWKDGRWTYANRQQAGSDLRMTHSDGSLAPIERVDPHEGRRTLGIRLAADGGDRDEISYLRQVCSDWAANIRNGHLPRHLAWQALTTYLWPKLSYPLAATTLTPADCRHIVAPALMAGLAASGIVGTFPRTLTHSSKESLGLGLWDLYTIQGWSQLLICLTHGPQPTSITGRLFRSSIETMKVELGLAGSLFLQDYAQLGHLSTPSWVQSIWKFLWEHDLELHESTPSLSLKREHDRFLIQSFLDLGYVKGDLRALNRCRVYLQVTTFADITSGCGSYITEMSRTGRFDPDIPRESRWPQQGRPGHSDWGVWRQALTRLCHSSPQWRLPIPLGRWLQDPPPLTWLYSPSTDRLYRQVHPQHWCFHQCRSHRSGRSVNRRFELIPNRCTPETVPSDLLRSIARVQGQYIVTSGFAAVVPKPILSPMRSFKQYLQQLPTLAQPVVSWLTVGQQAEQLGALLTQGRGIGVCDGSFKLGKGASSWIIGDQLHNVLVSGSWATPGLQGEQSALRSEIAGIYAISFMIYHACQYFKVSSGAFAVRCDNINALRLCFMNQRCRPTTPNFDLITTTQSLIHLTPVQWTWSHILSSEHPNNDWHQTVDRAAKQALISLPTPPDTWVLPHEQWPLLAPGLKLSHLNRSQFIHLITGKKGYAYWVKRQKLPVEAPAWIHQEALAAALNSIPWTRRVNVIKRISGHLAVGKNMKRYKKWEHDHCPRCGLPEDAPHVLTCPAPHMGDKWDKALTELQTWMDSVHSSPQLRDLIIFQLKQWLNRPLPAYSRPSFLDSLHQEQSRIGWDAFFNGFASRRWAALHQSFLQNQGNIHKGLRWLTALIRRFWEIAWDFWGDRNGYLHPPDMSADQSLTTKIQAQFDLGFQHLPIRAQRWFHHNLSELLSKPRQYRRLWLKHVSLLRASHEHQARSANRKSQEVMRNWLQRHDSHGPA